MASNIKLLKSKTFDKADAEYQSFFDYIDKIFDDLTVLLVFDLDEITSFMQRGGIVYYSEVETTEKDTLETSIKVAVSKAENFECADEVMVNILGANVSETMAEVATSVIENIATDASCYGYINTDNSMGDTIRITLAAKIFKKSEEEVTEDSEGLIQFNNGVYDLYELLRNTPKEKLPGLKKCGDYLYLYKLANSEDEYIDFVFEVECLAGKYTFDLNFNARFHGKNYDDAPKLIMEDILSNE